MLIAFSSVRSAFAAPATRPLAPASISQAETRTEAPALDATPKPPKDFATVATDARSTLDSFFAKLGKPASIYTPGTQWDEVLGTLDRRSLYAIASNEGGRFSELEQGHARNAMGQQLAEAIGLTNGTYSTDPAAGFRAGIAFLDGVSEEEQGSKVWATERAATQYSYEFTMRRDGREPEDFESDNPLVRMILEAMEDWAAMGAPTQRFEDWPQYQQAIALYA
jgi:hypothetical protein